MDLSIFKRSLTNKMYVAAFASTFSSPPPQPPYAPRISLIPSRNPPCTDEACFCTVVMDLFGLLADLISLDNAKESSPPSLCSDVDAAGGLLCFTLALPAYLAARYSRLMKPFRFWFFSICSDPVN